MNKNIDLTKILKNCPIGTKLYSTILGEVTFYYINENDMYPIKIMTKEEYIGNVSANGKHYADLDGECTLFPSKEQRDWNKFTAPWYKNDKFDPNTLQPFDKVLIRDDNYERWLCSTFSHIQKDAYPYSTASGTYLCCIPYNDNTKHLVGTTDEAPEYYRYWED